MPTETNPLTAELMYGGTVRDLQLVIGRAALVAQTTHGAIMSAARGRKMTDDEYDRHVLAVHATNNGAALVAVLSMLAEENPDLALKAANVVQDTAENGECWQEWGKDIWTALSAEES